MSILASAIRIELYRGSLVNRECDEVRGCSKCRVLYPNRRVSGVDRQVNRDESAEASAGVVMDTNRVWNGARHLAKRQASVLVSSRDVVSIGDKKTITHLRVRNEGCRARNGVPIGDHLDVERLARRLRNAKRHVHAPNVGIQRSVASGARCRSAAMTG